MAPPNASCDFQAVNRGPAINLTNWMCVVAVVLLVVLKILKRVIENIRAISSQSFEPSDYLIFAALALSVARNVIVSRQVTYGLGKGGIISSKLLLYQEFEYASQLLFLADLLLSKLALLFFLYPHAQQRVRIFWSIVGFTGVWCLGSLIVTAFQCPLPQPYLVLSRKCLNQSIIGITVQGVDALDEIAIIAFSLYLVCKMQMTKTRKSIITFFFAIRVALFPLMALRIIATFRTYTLPNRLAIAGSLAISSGVYMNVSLIITTIQCMLSMPPPSSNTRRSASFVGIPSSYFANPPTQLRSHSPQDVEKDVGMSPLSRPQTAGKTSTNGASSSSWDNNSEAGMSRKSLVPPPRPPRPGSLALPDGMIWSVVKAKNRSNTR